MTPLPCSYFVLRIVPHPHLGEGAPFAVVLQSRPAEFLGIRAITDPERLRAVAGGVELDLLLRYLESLQAIVAGREDAGAIALLSRPERFHWLAAPRSDVLQPTSVEHRVAADPEALLDELFSERVEHGGS